MPHGAEIAGGRAATRGRPGSRRLDGEQGQCWELGEAGLVDDGADAPAGGGKDQETEVTTFDRHRHVAGYRPIVRHIATAVVEHAVVNSIEPRTGSGTASRSMVR